MEKMSLKKRCDRIREIDKMITKLMDEKDALYNDGLTREQHNKLFNLVEADEEPHWI